MGMLTEQTNPTDRIEVLPDGSLQIREATAVLRDGVVDPEFPPRYHRYVLHPGDDVSERDARIAAIAAAVWTDEVINSFRDRAEQISSASDHSPSHE
jgi:hypothetical protein